jgi:hypothetical protein
MNSVVRKKKKTIIGRVIRKLESELTSKQKITISPNVYLDDSTLSDSDVVEIKTRRDELKVGKQDGSDVIIVIENNG